MSLTLNDIAQIKADATKAVTRQFRDAAEDHGWAPTPTPEAASAELPTDEQETTNGPTIAELRAQAKEAGLSAAGSKADIQARLDEHNAKGGE